jgi:hypothetical protein
LELQTFVCRKSSVCRYYQPDEHDCELDFDMKSSSLEPGLLPVFRLFTGLRLGLMVLGAASRLVIRGLPEQMDHSFAWFSFAEAALLMASIWSTLQRWLGRLPAHRLGTPPSGQSSTNLLLRERIDFGTGVSLVGAWQLLPPVYPLVFIGWQYNFRSVLCSA